MRKILFFILLSVCMLLSSCNNGDAPYTEIPKNIEGLNINGGEIDNVHLDDYKSILEIAENSDLVIECEYISPTEYLRVKAGKTAMNFTDHEFKTVSVLRGDFEDDTVTLRTYGGEVYFKDGKYDGYIEDYCGDPSEFAKGQKYLLFLSLPSPEYELNTKGEHYFLTAHFESLYYYDENSKTYKNGGTDEQPIPLTKESAQQYKRGLSFKAAELKSVLEDLPVKEGNYTDFKYGRILARHKIKEDVN